MKKIGFIDFYLNEWHANNYPAWIRDNISAKKRAMTFGPAWAEADAPDGTTTEKWCAVNDFYKAASLEEVTEEADFLFILSPDNPEKHWDYARQCFSARKPVFIDKTFAPDLETAKKIVTAAREAACPMFSSSALRFADQLRGVGRPHMLSTIGCGLFSNYAVHQVEMIVTLMKPGANRLRALNGGRYVLLEIEYCDGRRATFHQPDDWNIPFGFVAETADGIRTARDCTQTFINQIDAILDFFEHPEQPPVSTDEMLEVAAILDAGKRALADVGVWVPVSQSI